MKKSILALLLIPLLIFSGCAVRLSYEEYSSVLETSLQKQVEGIIGLDFTVIAIKDISEIDKIEGAEAKLRELFDLTKESLDKLYEITPPEEFEELHTRLLSSLEDEKQHLSLIEECLSAETQEEFEAAKDKITESYKAELENIGNPDRDENFGEVYDEIYQKLKDFIPE